MRAHTHEYTSGAATHRDGDGRGMFGGIAEDRDDEDSDEYVAEPEPVSGRFHHSDQDFAHPGD